MQSQNLTLKFKVLCRDTVEGDSVYMTGNLPQLGDWSTDKGVKLFTSPTEFPIWASQDVTLEVDLNDILSSLRKPKLDQDSVTIFEYKYYIKNENSKRPIQWEKFKGNRLFTKGVILENLNSIESEIDFENFDWTQKFIINGEIFNDNIIGPKISVESLDSIKEDHNQQQESIINISNKDSEIQPEVYTNSSEIKCKNEVEESPMTLDDYLSDISKALEEIKSNKFSLHDKINSLLESLKDTKRIDKELLVIILIHFYKSGQLKLPEDFSSYEHKHHHDSILARSIYTYLLQNITDENSILIRSVLSYLPTCLDYRVMEQQGEKNYN